MVSDATRDAGAGPPSRLLPCPYGQIKGLSRAMCGFIPAPRLHASVAGPSCTCQTHGRHVGSPNPTRQRVVSCLLPMRACSEATPARVIGPGWFRLFGSLPPQLDVVEHRRMVEPGDLITAFSPQPGRSFLMVYSVQLQATHCSERGGASGGGPRGQGLVCGGVWRARRR